MKEAVMISIKPKWCQLIASGKKTIEIRKTKPKLETPFKVYIYCTKPSKKHQTVFGCRVLNDDELFRLPNGKIKYGDSIEMMAYDNYTADNFLNGKIIGEFVCNKIYTIKPCGYDNRDIKLRIIDKQFYYKELDYNFLNKCQLSYLDIEKYSNGSNVYGWKISDLVIYDKPKELSKFSRQYSSKKISLKRPPQSWCYVNEY